MSGGEEKAEHSWLRVRGGTEPAHLVWRRLVARAAEPRLERVPRRRSRAQLGRRAHEQLRARLDLDGLEQHHHVVPVGAGLCRAHLGRGGPCLRLALGGAVQVAVHDELDVQREAAQLACLGWGLLEACLGWGLGLGLGLGQGLGQGQGQGQGLGWGSSWGWVGARAGVGLGLELGLGWGSSWGLGLDLG